MSLFILSAVFFGVQLMTLESIKNIVFARYLESVVVEAPILKANYNLRVMWDMTLIGSIVIYCLATTCAYFLGKKRAVS